MMESKTENQPREYATQDREYAIQDKEYSTENPPEIVNIATKTITNQDKILAKNKIRFMVDEANDPNFRSKTSTAIKRRTVGGGHQSRINDLKKKLEESNRICSRKASIVQNLKKRKEQEDQNNTWILPQVINERVKTQTFSVRTKKRLNDSNSKPHEEYSNINNSRGFGKERPKFIRQHPKIKDFQPNDQKVLTQNGKVRSKAGHHSLISNKDLKRGGLK